MMTVLIPVYTAINGRFTTSVPKSPVHAAGLHPPDAGSAVHTIPAGGQPFFSAYQPAVSALSAVQWHFLGVSVHAFFFVA